MRDFMRVTLALAFLAGVTTAANAQTAQVQDENTNVGTSAAEFLELGAGARGMSLGGAYTALARDVEALYYNPAGLPMMENGLEAALTIFPYFADTDYLWMGLAFPFAAGQYALGVSFGNFGFADQPIYTETDPENDSERTYSVSQSFIGLTFAHAFIDRFTGGVTVKYIQDRLGQADASTFAVDVGTNFHTEFAGRPIAFAVVIQNLGGQLEHSGSGLDFTAFPPEPSANVDPAPARYRAQSFPLPTTFKVGLAYDVLSMAASRVTLLGEFNERNNTDPSFGFAGEYAWDPADGPVSASLRASYSFQPDNYLTDGEKGEIGTRLTDGLSNKGLDGMALGGGLAYRFANYEAKFDYTFRHYGYLGSRNVFTLGFAVR
ncbi:MAG: PorV/PorQ family protein [Gemmatimonadota bacterium]|nr:MAG: PorV/PorQ family protein [Gemmatimonadota bacterium]